MKISDLAVNRPVAILMLVAIVVLLGTVSFSKLHVDLYPEMKLPVAGVIISYPGAGPEEIESQVTQPVEEAVGTIPNIEDIYSVTRSGTSIVICQFNWGTDMDFASLQIREKVDLIKRALPEEIEAPMVIKMDPAMMPILQIGLTGPQDLAELKTLAEDEVKTALERIPGVASVTITGGLEREVQITVDPVKLQNYGLSLSQVTSVLRADNFNQPGGEVAEAGKVLFVRSLGQFTSLEEIRNLPLTSAGGSTLYLRDVAEVTDGYKDVRQKTRMNGAPSIGIHVQKQSDANTVEVASEVKAQFELLKQKLPQDLQVAYVFDQSDYINRSLKSVQQRALEGALLAVVVIFLFLRNLRSTLIISLAIPLSIISTFILMYFAGITFNLVSMGGLALGIGRMVDDAIVVLECIYRYRSNGYSLYEAARQGASEVGNAVMAATFTTIAVFLPIVFVEGLSAMIFRQMALTVSFAIFSSLLVALTLVPMLASKALTVDAPAPAGKPVLLPGGGNWRQRLRARLDYLNWLLGRALNLWGGWIDRLNEVYLRVLQWALGRRRLVVTGISLLLVLSLALVPLVGAEFLPSMDAGQIAIDIQMDRGAVLERTDDLARQVEEVLEQVPEVDTVFTSVGSSGGMMSIGSQPDVSQLRVMLVPLAERSRPVGEVADEIRQRLSALPGAKIKVSVSDPMMGSMSTTTPISISIKGENLDLLRDLAEQAAAQVRAVEGTREVDTSLSTGYPEVQIAVDRQKASAYGITAAQVASVVRTAIEGQVATRYRTGGDEIDIRVRLKAEARENLRNVEDLVITSPGGAAVPLRDIARLDIGQGPSVINRSGQERVVTVSGEIAGRDLNSIMTDIRARLGGLSLPPGYSISYEGSNKEMMESFASLAQALLLAIVLVYMVMAIQYESLLYPLVIMFTIPTTVIGVVLGLVLTGRSFSVPAFIGLILLAGIVVSNGIVLVDYINTLRQRGMDRNQAILAAGPVRLRPILMTAITTILAMVPLALGLGEGGESQAPLATVVIGGMTVSTFLTLVLIPVVYTLFDDLGIKIKGWLRRRLTGEAAPPAGAAEG